MNFQTRIFVAVALCAAIFMIFGKLNPPPEPEDPTAAEATAGTGAGEGE